MWLTQFALQRGIYGMWALQRSLILLRRIWTASTLIPVDSS
jgi:hypothetical protein